MIDDVLGKYTGKRADDSNHNGKDDAEQLEDHRAFGYLRGVRDRALMLQLRKKDGNIRSVGYAWLENADFDPSEGITLHVSGKAIRIKGRNLNAEIRPNVRLYDGISRHRVPWIQEADQVTAMELGGKGILIESIDW